MEIAGSRGASSPKSVALADHAYIGTRDHLQFIEQRRILLHRLHGRPAEM